MDLDGLLLKIRVFNRERDWDQYHTPKNLAMALSVEVAELVEHFQWVTSDGSLDISSDKKEKVEEEIGDILIYLLNISDKLGIDPMKAATEKIEKNRRKYPLEKARGSSLKYDEL
ncbi:MAG: nucleotide pyrophosphohydrolase [Proteobacteria bacterium]|nr:nucleotide pyrophosphohydrolase [Pseudomonadota bacterium]